MHANLIKAREILEEQDCGLVVINACGTLTYQERGVRTLLTVPPGTLSGAFVADRVVGKAAALLLVRGGAIAVYARIISEPALKLFEKYHVVCIHGDVVQNVENRDRSGICPMESAVLEIDDPAKAYEVLTEKTKVWL